MGFVRGVLAIGLALALSACGLKEAYDQSTKAVAAFHQQLDAEQYKALWDGSTQTMKTASPEAQFIKAMTAVHARLGKVKLTKQVGLNVNTTNGLTTVQAVMDTEFERGKGREVFVFLQEGEKLLLQNYEIQSPELTAP